MKTGLLSLTLTFTALWGIAVKADDAYPSRPITWVVPFAAGSISDATARLISTPLSARLGQPVVVENRPGAGGVVGLEYVAGSKPDGYTLVFGSSGPMAVNPSLYKGKLSYDPLKSFVPVQMLFASRMMIVTHPSAPFRTLEELVAFAKKNPEKVNYGSPGPGVAQHLTVAMFEHEAGIKMTHIPYKSGPSQMADLMAGVTDLAFEYLDVVRPLVQAGKLRPLAMTGNQRFKQFPDVPSVAELGFPGTVNGAWAMVALPANAPKKIVDKLADGFREALRDSAVVKRFQDSDSDILADIGPDSIRDFLSKEIDRYRIVVETSGASAN